MNKMIIGIVDNTDYIDRDSFFCEGTRMIDYLKNNDNYICVAIFPDKAYRYNKKSDYHAIYYNSNSIKDIRETVSFCDAIIKVGNSNLTNIDSVIYDFCVQKNIPYLGIDSGMYLMGSYHSDSKIEKIDINNEIPVFHNRSRKYGHSIDIINGTLLHDIINKDMIIIDSKHTNHINASGVQRVSALSLDGVIEAIDNPTCTFHLGLQWHPNYLNDEDSIKIFNSLNEAAYTYKKQKKL